MRVGIVCLCFALAACGGLPRIEFGKTTVAAPKDAGTPATLNNDATTTTIPIPAKTQVVIVKVEGVPATATTSARPAQELTFFDFSQPSQFEQIANKLAASTGTIDTSVAKHRIDAEGRKMWIWFSGGAALGAIAFLYFRYPLGAICCAGASAVFFLFYQLSSLPAWFWAIGFVMIAGGVGLAAGFKRKELDENGDGIPDRLQRPQSP